MGSLVDVLVEVLLSRVGWLEHPAREVFGKQEVGAPCYCLLKGRQGPDPLPLLTTTLLSLSLLLWLLWWLLWLLHGEYGVAMDESWALVMFTEEEEEEVVDEVAPLR